MTFFFCGPAHPHLAAIVRTFWPGHVCPHYTNGAFALAPDLALASDRYHGNADVATAGNAAESGHCGLCCVLV